MKYEVLKPFVCKNSRVLYESGVFYETEDTKRVNELAKGGYIKTDKPKKTTTAKTNEKAVDKE